MAKNKKWISVLMAFALVLSCFSAGLVAFAESAADGESVTAAPNTANKVPELAVDEDAAALLETYKALSEDEENMTDMQKAKLQQVEEMLSDFAFSKSADASAQVNAIFAALSDVAGRVLTGKSGPIADIEAKIDAFSGSLNKAEPVEEDLKAYNEILAAYTALTDTQKGEMDVMMFDKMFHLVLDREYQLAKIAAPSEASKVLYGNALASAKTILGSAGYTACLDEAQALSVKISDTKLSAQEKLDAFAAASENARMFSALWNATFNTFYNKLDSLSAGKSGVTIAQALEKEWIAANPFTETAPASVSKPNVKNYPNGADDPAYISDNAKYIQYMNDKADYEVRKANHTAKYDLQGMEKVAAVAPEYKAVIDLIKDAIAANAAFIDDPVSATPKAKAVVKDFDKLSLYQQTIILKNTTIKYWAVAEYNTYYSYNQCKTKSAKDLYNKCIDIEAYQLVLDFINVINGIDEPYTNEDIPVAKAAYKLIPTSLQSNIPGDIMAKYQAILASVTPDIPSIEKPVLGVYTKTVVTYPEKATRAQVETALPRIENLLTDVFLPLLGVDGGLTNMVKTELYTNATVAELAKALYPMLAGLTELLSTTPDQLAEKLIEDKYAGAVAALKATNGNWEVLTFADGDMGFRDGDKEGFMDAVSALFRPLAILTLALPFENQLNAIQGTYTYGAYEELVSIFEVLDLEGYMSSVEYTEYVGKAESHMAMDARIRPILVPVFNLIDKFAAAPLDTLLEVLPKFGWALKSNLLNNQVSALIGRIAFVTVTPPDLTPEGFYDLVMPMLENITIGEGDTATTLSLKFDKAKFVQFVNDIGGCGTAVVKDSVARGQAYRLGINSDKPDAFVVLFRWLYSEITTKENITSIKGAVDASNQNTIVKMLIKTVINRIAETPTNDALVALVNLAAPKAPEIEIPGEITDLFPSKGDKNDGDDKTDGGITDNSTPKTDNPTIPTTGGSVMTICFSLLATASLAGGALLLKKKIEE